jgi:hypothetical protein
MEVILEEEAESMERVLLFIAGAFLLFACSSSKKLSLHDSAELYSKSLYRADLGALMSQVKAEKQEQFFAHMKEIENLRISYSELDQILPIEENKSALVSLKLSYYSPEHLDLLEETRLFSFDYDPKSERWVVNESHPLGRKPSRNHP